MEPEVTLLPARLLARECEATRGMVANGVVVVDVGVGIDALVDQLSTYARDLSCCRRNALRSWY